MPSFSPADADSLWFDIGSDPVLIQLPPRASGGLWLGPSMRIGVPAGGADVLLRFGGPQVVVTADNGILFSAGNLEIWSMGDSTFLSAMAPDGPSRLCITIGHGE